MGLTSVAAGEAQARVAIYGFLASVFTSHPTEDSVRGVCRMAEELGIPFPGGLAPIDLDREYMEMFVVPNPRYVAPYESVFRDRWMLPVAPGPSPDSATSLMIKGLLMGESTLAVRQFYLNAGLMPMEDLPDHLGNELRFMAYLWAKEVEAPAGEAGALAELRVRFPREHLLRWIGPLRERVEESDRLGYYRAALQVLEAVLRDEE